MSLVLEFASCVVKNLVNVPEDVMDGWVKNPRALQNALTKALCPPQTEECKQQVLLRKIATVTVAGTKKFVAKDRLKPANVGWMSSNFDQLFKEKVEENVPDIVIATHKLEKNSLDAPILAELGNRAEISLAHLFVLIEKQSKGEEGVLLINGYANIAYVRGTDGNLWAVGAGWNSGDRYWHVLASSVENPNGWGDGNQILSRDS